jgi:CRISPR-associated endonuclease Csn1
MQRIWGFDIGTTSVGFAVVDLDEEKESGSIVHEGVRIFPEGRTEKDLEPRNQARRAARLLRRQVRRRRLRRKFLRQAFADAGLLPSYGQAQWDEFMNSGVDPYELRARGQHDKLLPLEIGRALYHLCHRRGFLSARRADDRPSEKKARDKEEGPIKAEIQGLSTKLEGLPLGEFLYLAGLEKAERDQLMKSWNVQNLHLEGLKQRERRRSRHVGRTMVMEEFQRLWNTQAKFYPGLLTSELEDKVRETFTYQRPIFWRLQTVGQCALEPEEPACPKGSWLGQQFLMLQQLNNLRLRFPDQPARWLDDEERKILLEKLGHQTSLEFGGVRTSLKKLWKERGLSLKPEINFESGNEKRLAGNAVEAKLAEVFSDSWVTHPDRERLRAELYHRAFAIYNRRVGNKRIELHRKDEFKDEIAPAKAKFVEEAQKDFGLSREQADHLAAFEPPAGWLRFSAKALQRLIPILEEKFGLNEIGGALDQAYPNWKAGNERVLERLPSHPKAMPVSRNPSVNRALNEVRKVANNLLHGYGKPDLIRIELLRELKKTKKQRLEITSRYGKNRDIREAAKRDLEKNGVQPTPEAKDKWVLWQESGEYCPYTGRKICFDDLFRRGEFQIEHIFPLSRSLDNNLTNKTLCATDVNKNKGNQTPFEYFQSRPDAWKEIRDQLEGWAEAGRFPKEKMKAFLREDYPPGQEELEERQKADSSYIAVEARKFLARLGVPVEVVNGQVTAQLRSHWGLDAILNPGSPRVKNRQDHRHHAVDALAVALTTRGFVKRLSDYYSHERRGEKPKFKPPWENTFWLDAEGKTKEIIVSHRVQRKISGPLHALTYYGDTGENIAQGGIIYRKFVTRKDIKDLTESEVKGEKRSRIRDDTIRALIQGELAKRGGKPAEAFGGGDRLVLPPNKKKKQRKEAAGEPAISPVIESVRLEVKQQSHLMVPVWPKLKSGVPPKTFADLGGNYCMAIYRLADGTACHHTITLPEATAQLKDKSKKHQPVVRQVLENGARLVMSLAPGDILEISKGQEREYMVVRYCNEKGRVFYKPHTMALDPTKMKPPQPEVSFGPDALLGPDIRKVAVDPIGRVRPAND